MNNLHDIIVKSFADYESWLLDVPWRGKEHDCVNLFAHKFLFSHLHPNGPISDPTQIGIEIGVPQPPGIGTKKAARKDLVIWRDKESSTWDESWCAFRYPIAIIEWKARRVESKNGPLFPHDLAWITAYSRMSSDHLGYCATVDFTSKDRRVYTAYIRDGIVNRDFHRNEN